MNDKDVTEFEAGWVVRVAAKINPMNANNVRQDIGVSVLRDLLVEKGILSREELNERYVQLLKDNEGNIMGGDVQTISPIQPGNL